MCATSPAPAAASRRAARRSAHAWKRGSAARRKVAEKPGLKASRWRRHGSRAVSTIDCGPSTGSRSAAGCAGGRAAFCRNLRRVWCWCCSPLLMTRPGLSRAAQQQAKAGRTTTQPPTHVQRRLGPVVRLKRVAQRLRVGHAHDGRQARLRAVAGTVWPAGLERHGTRWRQAPGGAREGCSTGPPAASQLPTSCHSMKGDLYSRSHSSSMSSTFRPWARCHSSSGAWSSPGTSGGRVGCRACGGGEPVRAASEALAARRTPLVHLAPLLAALLPVLVLPLRLG